MFTLGSTVKPLFSEHQSPPQLRYHFVVPLEVQVVPSSALTVPVAALSLRRPKDGVVSIERERARQHLRHDRVVHQQRRDARKLLRAALWREPNLVPNLSLLQFLVGETYLDSVAFGRSNDEIVGDASRVEVQGDPDGQGQSRGATAVGLSHEERPVGLAQENFQRQVPGK